MSPAEGQPYKREERVPEKVNVCVYMKGILKQEH